jgi:Ni,Fe-hydrogenase I large subunit
MATIIVDPLTRIEGHNRWIVEASAPNLTVSSAKSAGTLFRGFENILKNRDPRDAPQITQRICGV